jgi:hypothetical protein
MTGRVLVHVTGRARLRQLKSSLTSIYRGSDRILQDFVVDMHMHPAQSHLMPMVPATVPRTWEPSVVITPSITAFPAIALSLEPDRSKTKNNRSNNTILILHEACTRVGEWLGNKRYVSVPSHSIREPPFVAHSSPSPNQGPSSPNPRGPSLLSYCTIHANDEGQKPLCGAHSCENALFVLGNQVGV